MIKQIIFFSCLVFVTYAQFVCDPYQDCAKGFVNDLVPDLYNCTRYYVCLTSSTVPVPSDASIPCPSGQYFSASVFPARCVDETVSGVCTDDYCAKYEAEKCPSTCPLSMNYDYVVYPGDCTKYYVCTPVGVIVGACSDPTPYFNGKTCVSDASDCCYRCKPYCTEPGTEIPDPYDSKKYFVCTATGPADELTHSTCPAGDCFDSPLGYCVLGNTCPQFC